MKDENYIPDEKQNGDNLPPALKGLQGKDPFAVPEGYFDELPGRIMQRIGQQGSPSKLKLLFRRPMIPVSLAAAMIGLMIMFYFLLKPEEQNIRTNYLAENSQNVKAIEDYLLNSSDVDEDAIVEAIVDDQETPVINLENPFYTGNDSIPANKDKETVIPADTTITPDDIINYLLDEDYDPDTDL
jgi:hypothetical protein